MRWLVTVILELNTYGEKGLLYCIFLNFTFYRNDFKTELTTVNKMCRYI